MFRHVVTNPTASCHLIRGLVTYDTWPRDLWYEPTYQKVRASHHNHHNIINISGTGVCYDEINRRLPNAGERACGGCGNMETTWGAGQLDGEAQFEDGKAWTECGKERHEKSKAQTKDYDAQFENNKNTNREGVFIQIPRARALASKKLLSYCINVYDFCWECVKNIYLLMRISNKSY